MHTHLEQWGADANVSGEQLGDQCLALGTHLNHGQFLPEPRFEPTTLGYKTDALSIRPPEPPPLDGVWREDAPSGGGRNVPVSCVSTCFLCFHAHIWFSCSSIAISLLLVQLVPAVCVDYVPGLSR